MNVIQAIIDLFYKSGEIQMSNTLIAGGIFFLLLAVGLRIKNFSGRVNQILAGIIGVSLIVAGLISGTPINISTSVPPTPAECKFNNLLNCSVAKPIMEGGVITSTISASGNIKMDYNNGPGYSGVAFQFNPALDVKGFTHLDISGSATENAKFVVEYKVREEDKPKEIAKSSFLILPKGEDVSVRTPLTFTTAIDEIVLMFYEKDEHSVVTIESMYLR